MSKKTALAVITACLLAASLLAFAQSAKTKPAADKQPVLIVLYSRFYDHSHPHMADERVHRLLPLIERLRAQYPNSGVSALLQFSGAMSQIVDEENSAQHVADQVRDSVKRGLVEVGYTGDEEPSYLYRPRPNLLLADTIDERFSLKAEAAEKFLTDYKNPVTGVPAAGLNGGLKRMQEVFGKAAFISGANPTLFAAGGDTAVTHEIYKLNDSAVLAGVPVPDPRRGSEGWGASANSFARFLSPTPAESPEMYWAEGSLHLSDSSLADNKAHITDDGVDAIKAALGKLDRSHVRVIKLEVASYKRYLARRPDGSVIWDPMEWLYYHPDSPQFPPNMKAFTVQSTIDDAYRKEEALLKWLLDDFFPANPGSRFVSMNDLKQMASAAGDSQEISRDEIKALASDIDARYSILPMEAPNFAGAGNRYFSLAESFELLSKALTSLDKKGSVPEKVKLTRVYGPLEIPDDNMGPTNGSFTVSEVTHLAADLSGKFSSNEWKTVPDNAVPMWIQTRSQRINAAQFLRLMAQAYLNAGSNKVLQINPVQVCSRATFMYPKNTATSENGLGWTFKPAPLHLPVAAAASASQRAGE